jgi:hypothetical protein
MIPGIAYQQTYSQSLCHAPVTCLLKAQHLQHTVVDVVVVVDVVA